MGAGRILDQATVLGGFHVPKGTVVVAMNQVKICHVLYYVHFYSQVMCRQERFFSDANSFLPERWLPEGTQPPPGVPGPQWASMTLTTCNLSRSVLGSPIRPRASRLHWSVPGLLFLPNGCLDNGFMIFNNLNRSKACRGFSCPPPHPPVCKIQVL